LRSGFQYSSCAWSAKDLAAALFAGVGSAIAIPFSVSKRG
jgi:hypothetical protein